MGILIDKVRIANYRVIKNIEVNLSEITLLVGANNSGKTSFLKALHLALGIDRRIVTKDDFHDDGKTNPDNLEIIIDIRIIAIDIDGNRIPEFDNEWADNDFSGSDIIKFDLNTNEQFVAFRTKYKFNNITNDYRSEVALLKQWSEFENWQTTDFEGSKFAKPQTFPLIFMDAQRDIQNDLKDRSSFLGKLTNKPEINPNEIGPIEKSLNDLNERIVTESKSLSHLKNKLIELNNTVNVQGDGVEISPLNKKLKDIGRNLNILFKDINAQSFPLENHGMGTRSWASLLTLKAYISWMEENTKPYYPLLALEEPEAHLHPNAQRQLFQQLKTINGQKIISTHSPFVAAQSKLTDLRHFYKEQTGIIIGQILLCDKEEAEIGKLQEMIKNEGNTKEIKKEICPQISQLIESKQGKLNSEEARKIEREIMNTRGELIFSKAVILFEGETEEQALPILAKDYFGHFTFELGINFIGVGGKNYAPFISSAKALNIPWYILSDGDGQTEEEVKSQIKNIYNKVPPNKLFVLDTYKFEEYLVEKGYEKQLIKAINLSEKKESYFPDDFINAFNDQRGTGGKIRDYKSDPDNGKKRALLDCMLSDKTKYAPAIAEQIVKSKSVGNCNTPPVINSLFEQISLDLKITLP